MKRLLLSWAAPLLLILFSLASFQAQAQCNESQPRPITGNQHPCPGDIETYFIANDRNYTSFEWDVPRAHAGEPPVGWEIISGQGTSKITVRVGQKSGTVKVKVTDPECGTKVATLPVKPGKNFEVVLAGPNEVCPGESQTYTASVKKTNGKGNLKGEFIFNWTVPAGWVIESGQGTESIVVIPGPEAGEVNVYVSDNTEVSGNGNNGTGVGGYKQGYCGLASDGLAVKIGEDCQGGPCPADALSFNVVAPDTICNLSDDLARFEVDNIREGVTYEFILPDGLIALEEGNGYVEVVAVLEEDQLGQPLTVSVVARNECGESTQEFQVVVVECEPGNPLPVSMTRFEGISRGGAVELSWATASEINNDRFEVERSTDAKGYTMIGQVKGGGNSNVSIDYSFADASAPRGTVYYRLRQVDLDGSHEYSKVIAVSHSGGAAYGETSMSLFPNPTADGRVTIKFAGAQGGLSVKLTDLSGKVLHSQGVAAGSSLVGMDLSQLNLNKGVYLITVSGDGQSQTQRLVVR